MIRASLLSLLMVITLFILTSCQTAQATPEEPEASIEVPEVPTTLSAMPGVFSVSLLGYANLDELLRDVALVYFDESRRFSEGRHNHNYYVFKEIRELYMPYNMPENFPLFRISIGAIEYGDPITFSYRLPNFHIYTGHSPETARFTWHRDRPTDEVFFRGGRPVSPTADDVRYHWSQHGYEFEARIHARFPEEAYELTASLLNPQPINAWEIQGNAVSVSIQGIDGITIFNEDDYELISKITDPPHFFGVGRPDLDHHSLYVNNDEGLIRVGYSWRAGVNSSRQQFVLKPGTYTFYVEGEVSRDLVVRHFADREIISSTNFRRELLGQDFSSFVLTVTPDSSGSGDTVTLNP